MGRKVRSVRVPKPLETLDLSGVVHECERFLRDLESAAMLRKQGNREAAEALIHAREEDLGRQVGRMVWEARVHYGKTRESEQ